MNTVVVMQEHRNPLYRRRRKHTKNSMKSRRKHDFQFASCRFQQLKKRAVIALCFLLAVQKPKQRAVVHNSLSFARFFIHFTHFFIHQPQHKKSPPLLLRSSLCPRPDLRECHIVLLLILLLHALVPGRTMLLLLLRVLLIEVEDQMIFLHWTELHPPADIQWHPREDCNQIPVILPILYHMIATHIQRMSLHLEHRTNKLVFILPLVQGFRCLLHHTL